MELDKDYKMYRVKALAYWIMINTVYVFGLSYINSMKVTKVNDGTIRIIDATALFLAGIVLYKVTFGMAHILWFKIRIMCNKDMKVNDVDLKREIKRLKKGNANDSEMGSLLSLEQDFVNEEEGATNDDNKLLDVSMRPDRKMDQALKKKMDNLKKKTADNADEMSKTFYNDADDDDKDFLDAK